LTDFLFKEYMLQVSKKRSLEEDKKPQLPETELALSAVGKSVFGRLNSALSSKKEEIPIDHSTEPPEEPSDVLTGGRIMPQSFDPSTVGE